VIVFVHGVPETDAIWRKVRAFVDGESVAAALPGFGSARPDGFPATKDAYVDWLVGELDRIDEPIDLVGHDWGAILTFRIATLYGERLRSWVADVGNCAHPTYVWHEFAQLWQTPGDGEAFVEAQAATPIDQRAQGLAALGVPAEDAVELATGWDETMGYCILDLYRSAKPNVHADWGPWQPTSAPGLIVHTVDDPFSNDALARETANLLGADVAVLDGPGHFWPYQAPERGAELLRRFWSRIG
jgi:pimeloyl-ACP methyl ester carboxylesterase